MGEDFLEKEEYNLENNAFYLKKLVWFAKGEYDLGRKEFDNWWNLAWRRRESWLCLKSGLFDLEKDDVDFTKYTLVSNQEEFSLGKYEFELEEFEQ